MYLHHEDNDINIAKIHLNKGKELNCPLCIAYSANEFKESDPDKYIKVFTEMANAGITYFCIELFRYYFEKQLINNLTDFLDSLNNNIAIKTVRTARIFYIINCPSKFLSANEITKKYDEELYYVENACFYYEKMDIENFTFYSLKAIEHYNNALCISRLLDHYFYNCSNKKLSEIFKIIMNYCNHQTLIDCFRLDEQEAFKNYDTLKLYRILENVTVEKYEPCYEKYNLCMDELIKCIYVQNYLLLAKATCYATC